MNTRWTIALLTTALMAATRGTAQPAPAQTETETDRVQLEIRMLSLSPTFGGHPIENAPPLKKYLESILDISWPAGSFIRHVPRFEMLVVKNTPESLSRIEEFIKTNHSPITQIEVQLDFVEYDMKDIDALARANKLSSVSLLALWENEQAKLLYSPRVVTQSGQEATVKGVTEHIYPTAFTIDHLSSTNATGTAVLEGVVKPSAFETREVGVLLAVLPEINAQGNLINLTLTPEVVYPPAWKDYGTVQRTADGGTVELKMEQPFFHTHTLTTQVMLSNGAMVMIGGGMKNETGDKTVYVFATARIIDTEGNFFKPNDPVIRKKMIELQLNLDNDSRPADASNPDALEFRQFKVLGSIRDAFWSIHDSAITEKDFLRIYGQVEWLEGSNAILDLSSGQFLVRNTRENLRRIEQTLTNLLLIPCQIEIQLDYIEYNTMDIDALARANKLSSASLLALWKDEQAKLLYSPRIVTQSGQEATVKGVTEYIYPTTFDIAHANSTNAAGLAVDAGLVEPKHFEVREVGTILAVLPETNPNRSVIFLTLTPQTVRPPTWKNYGALRHAPNGEKNDLRMQQPFFHTYALIPATVSVSNGAKILIGGGMKNETGDKTVFVFLTARLIDTEGNPISTTDASSASQP